MSIQLTPEQEKALEQLREFFLNPDLRTMRLRGFSGSGKTTLLGVFREKILKDIKLFEDMGTPIETRIEFTATMKQAATELGKRLGVSAPTVYSFLGLRLKFDRKLGREILIPRNSDGKIDIPKNTLLVIDEASCIGAPTTEDDEPWTLMNYLNYVLESYPSTKILYVGDPDQLLEVGAKTPYVFDIKVDCEATLTKIMRQKITQSASSSPVADLGQKFRLAVENPSLAPEIVPDNQSIIALEGIDFQEELESYFSTADMALPMGKFMAFRNARVNEVNSLIRSLRGLPEDAYAVREKIIINEPVVCPDTEEVLIPNGKICTVQSRKEDVYKYYGFSSTPLEIECDRYLVHYLDDDGTDNRKVIFIPYDKTWYQNFLSSVYSECNRKRSYYPYIKLKNQFANVRPIFAQTTHKSQGSTFPVSFIDINDFLTLRRKPSEVMRLLYVSTTRTQQTNYLYGVEEYNAWRKSLIK